MKLPRPTGRGYTRKGLAVWATVAVCFLALALIQIVAVWWEPAWAENTVTILGLVYWGAIAVGMFFRPTVEKRCIATVSNLTEAQMYRYPEIVNFGPDEERPLLVIAWINQHHVVVTFNPDDLPFDHIVERVRKLTEVEEDVYGHSGAHGGEKHRAGKRFRVPQPGVTGA